MKKKKEYIFRKKNRKEVSKMAVATKPRRSIAYSESVEVVSVGEKKKIEKMSAFAMALQKNNEEIAKEKKIDFSKVRKR